MKTFLLFVLASTCCLGYANAAMNTIGADNEELWQDHSLVYAIVKSVTNVGQGEYRITISPVATFSGKFDCGRTSEVAMTLIAGEASAISAPPEAGSRALFFVREKEVPQAGGRMIKEFRIPSSIVSFMPAKSAFTKVSGIEDKVIEDVVLTVRNARTKTGQQENK